MGAPPFSDNNTGVGMECNRLLQQQPADDDEEVVVHISGCRSRSRSQRGAWSPACATTAATNILQELFVLDGGSLERMMAVTSQGEVWR